MSFSLKCFLFMKHCNYLCMQKKENVWHKIYFDLS